MRFTNLLTYLLTYSSLVKLYYTKMTIHPLFTAHTIRPFCVFIEAEWSIYQNVQYFIRSKKDVFNLPQLDILYTSAMKRYH